ncbi:MAG: DUF222 domain-containing protein [Candidatus Nanopelagicales bacterium]
MDLAHVDVIPAPAGVAVSFVESQWHRISAELESERAMARLADMLDREPGWSDLSLLREVHDVELDQTGRLMRLMATRRVLSFLEGQTVRDVVDIVGEQEPAEVMSERTNRHEVGLALGRTKEQAQFQIAVYRRLVADFPHFVEALTAGQITLGHCHALHEETLVVADPEVLARIAGRALPFAQSQSVGRFRTSLRRLIAKHDPDAAERRRQARRQRRVTFSNLGDGISSMTVVGRTEDVDAVRDLVEDAAAQLLAADKDACTRDPGRERLTAGQARSDAVVAALLGKVDADGTVTYEPREHRTTRLELVIDAATAASLRDDLARLGPDPIPAGIARALMVDADVIARALVAEGTGHLLDLGRDVYLNNRQRRHVKARDRATCRACGRRATRGEMDHLVPFLAGGPSAPWNEWWLCRDCHQRKTADHLRVQGRADGQVEISTPAGIVYTSSPPPYLDDPDRDSDLAAAQPAVRFALPPRRPSPGQREPARANPTSRGAAGTDGDPPPF